MFYIYINFYQDSMSIQSVSCSVVSDSLRLYGLQPAMLLCPRISVGQNTGVGGQFLLQGIFPTEGSILFFRAQGTNAMWYPGGEGSLGENGYIYMCGCLFVVHLKLSQHCQSAILQYKIQSLIKRFLKKIPYLSWCSYVLSRSVMSNSLQPHGL